MAGNGSNADPGALSSNAVIMQDRVRIMRACYGGTQAMRDMEEEFLPRYDQETATRWETRKNSTFALNKLREAVDAASAKPFRTIIQVNNVDPDFELMMKDIDLQGNHLHLFAHQLFNNGLLDSMGHILVDHPDTIDLPNLAAQKAANIRPFWKLIRTSDVVAAYDDYVGGDVQTTHVRIRSIRIERDADFKEKVFNQIFVMEKEPGTDNGVVQLWEQEASSGGGKFTKVAEKAIPLTEVPFVTFYAGDKEGDYLCRPVFTDLAYKQIEHWQSTSDQRSILSAARFPMLAASGVQLDDNGDGANFSVGPYKLLVSPEANGKWYYVEPKGTAIESGRKDLEMIEMHMDMMALNPVTGTHRQYVPQNERNIQETRVHSVVHDLTISVQDAIEKAIRYTGAWTGNPDRYIDAQVILNKDFSNAADNLAEAAQIVALWEKRGLSIETMLTEIRARNLLGENFSLQEELKLLAQVAQVSGEVEKTPTGVAPTAEQKAQADAGMESWPAGQNRPAAQV